MDPLELAAQLGPDQALIYRHFGDPEAGKLARQIATIRDVRGFLLLIGSDPELAISVGADGIHLAERDWRRISILRRERPGWLITTAAHSAGAAHRYLQLGADLAIRSSVLPSRSPSAGTPMGIPRLAIEANRHPGRLVALGGMSPRSISRVLHAGAVAVASVEAAAAFMGLRHCNRSTRIFGPSNYGSVKLRT